MKRRVDVGHQLEGTRARSHEQHRRPAITSVSNALVKRIRALHSRKERDRSGTCFVEGIRIVATALDAGAEIETLVVAPDLLESAFARRLVERAVAQGVPVLDVSAAVFASLSRRDGPQGLGAVLRQRWHDLERLDPPARGVWVALDETQDHGNVGTILRTCDAVAAAGVILVGPSADPYDPAALRASTGAALTLSIARTSWEHLVQWARRHGVALVGTTGTSPTTYRAAEYPARLALVMGSEREGLSRRQLDACDLAVSIPMEGTVDSLNLAVATSIILYEIYDQHRRQRMP